MFLSSLKRTGKNITSILLTVDQGDLTNIAYHDLDPNPERSSKPLKNLRHNKLHCVISHTCSNSYVLIHMEQASLIVIIYHIYLCLIPFQNSIY